MNPWGLLVAIGLFVAGVATGIKVHSDHTDAQLLVQERAHHEAFKQAAAVSREIAQTIAKELTSERATREVAAQTFRTELRNARQAGRALATRAPATAEATMVAVAPDVGELGRAALRVPEPRFTGEFVRLYDLALVAAGLPAPGDPGGTDAGAAGADTVDAETVLAVHGDNADAWGQCRTIARGWQALARKHGWVK